MGSGFYIPYSYKGQEPTIQVTGSPRDIDIDIYKQTTMHCSKGSLPTFQMRLAVIHDVPDLSEM